MSKQSEVLAYIKAYIQENNIPPSLRDISSEFGWASSNSARYHIHALEKAGLVVYRAGKHRSISLVRSAARSDDA